MVKFLGKEYNELQAFIKDNTSGDATVFPYMYKKSSIVIIAWVEIKCTLLDTESIIVITISNYNNF